MATLLINVSHICEYSGNSVWSSPSSAYFKSHQGGGNTGKWGRRWRTDRLFFPLSFFSFFNKETQLEMTQYRQTDAKTQIWHFHGNFFMKITCNVYKRDKIWHANLICSLFVNNKNIISLLDVSLPRLYKDFLIQTEKSSRCFFFWFCWISVFFYLHACVSAVYRVKAVFSASSSLMYIYVFWLSKPLFQQQCSRKSHFLQIILFIQYERHILHQCSLHSRSSKQTCVTNN